MDPGLRRNDAFKTNARGKATKWTQPSKCDSEPERCQNQRRAPQTQRSVYCPSGSGYRTELFHRQPILQFEGDSTSRYSVKPCLEGSRRATERYQRVLGPETPSQRGFSLSITKNTQISPDHGLVFHMNRVFAFNLVEWHI
jgi:hypothetical protein